MRSLRSVLAAVLLVFLGVTVLGLLSGSEEAFAQKTSLPPIAQCEGVIAFSEKVENKYQQVTVIDPKQRALCVYHISLVDGQIALKSVRNFHWDTQILEWNSANPLPKEIQALLEQR